MAVSVVERTTGGPPSRLLVLLPGFGDEPTVFTRHLAALDPDNEWQIAVVRPPVPTPDGPAWFRSGDDGPHPDDLAAAIAGLGELSAEALHRLGLDESRVVYAGYSQGGAVALAAALDPTATVRPAAVAALAAFLPHRDVPQDPSRLAGRPVLVAHGADDDVVDALLGRSVAKALERAGAEVTWAEVDGDHALDPHLVAALRTWLASLPEPA